MFTDAEKVFIGNLTEPGRVRLACIATSTPDGRPHVVPLRAVLNETGDKVIVLGNAMAQSFKYQQVKKNPKVAIVWDGDNPNPPHPIFGVEVRGTAEIKHPEGDKDPHFEVTPTKVFSWGINEPAADSLENKMGMDVTHLRRRYG